MRETRNSPKKTTKLCSVQIHKIGENTFFRPLATSRLPSLKNCNEVDVIKAIFANSILKKVIRKLKLPETSSLSEYLRTRGLGYEEFRLIQFMAGAAPETAKTVLLLRKSQSLKQFSKKICQFLKKSDEEILALYSELSARLSSNTENMHTKPYFEKVRFLSALEFNNDIEQAAKILSIKTDELKEFISSHKIVLRNIQLKNTPVNNLTDVMVFFPKESAKDAEEEYDLGVNNIFENDKWPNFLDLISN